MSELNLAECRNIAESIRGLFSTTEDGEKIRHIILTLCDEIALHRTPEPAQGDNKGDILSEESYDLDLERAVKVYTSPSELFLLLKRLKRHDTVLRQRLEEFEARETAWQTMCESFVGSSIMADEFDGAPHKPAQGEILSKGDIKVALDKVFDPNTLSREANACYRLIIAHDQALRQRLEEAKQQLAEQEKRINDLEKLQDFWKQRYEKLVALHSPTP